MRLVLALLATLLLATPAQAATGTWIVTLDGPRTATTQRVLDTGAAVVGFEHLPFVAVRATDVQLEAIRRLPGVARVDANHRLEYAMDETRGAIGVPQLHVEGVTGEGVTVAVADSGADASHPDLQGAIRAHHQAVASTGDVLSIGWAQGVRAEDVPVAFELEADAPATDATSGHGTHVSGIVAGRGTASGGKYRGVAPAARLVTAAMGGATVILAPLVAYDWILEVRERFDIQAVNGSWGSVPLEGLSVRDPQHPINVTTKRLHDAGVAVVFAAMNDGPREGTTNVWGGWPWTITVGNACIETKPLSAEVCADGISGVYPGSSRGTADGRVPGPDLVAPGVDVVSLRAAGTGARQLKDDMDFCAISLAELAAHTCLIGTSMAAPHVTGTIALMEQVAKRDLSPDEVKAILTKTARPLPGTAAHVQGAGLLDAAAAVKRAR